MQLNVITTTPETQSPRPRVYSSPALVCSQCGHAFAYGDVNPCGGDQDVIENYERNPLCWCGGTYQLNSITQRYERDGRYWCETMRRYAMTADCPTPECWSKSCHLANAMAAKVAEDVRLMELAEDELAAWEDIAFGCYQEDNCEEASNV